MIYLLGLGGMAAGILGGLLGIGGGILIMPILRFGLGLGPGEAAGTCVVAVFFTTLGGSVEHFELGHVHIRSLMPVMGSGLVSALLFSTLFVYLPHRDIWLDGAIGLVFSLVSLRMVWEGISQYLARRSEVQWGPVVKGSLFSKVAIGAAAGLLPGLLGIGTGAVLVPAFSFALNAPMKIAIGSSLACFSLNALASSTAKLLQGAVQIHLLAPLCLGTFMGSRMGGRLNARFAPPSLKILFGMVFALVAVKYFVLLADSIG
jgi:uncharacterized membrane protein YfcA